MYGMGVTGQGSRHQIFPSYACKWMDVHMCVSVLASVYIECKRNSEFPIEITTTKRIGNVMHPDT